MAKNSKICVKCAQEKAEKYFGPNEEVCSFCRFNRRISNDSDQYSAVTRSEKEKIRAKIADDVENYLSNGGIIEQVESQEVGYDAAQPFGLRELSFQEWRNSGLG